MLTILIAVIILVLLVVVAFWLIDKIGFQPDTAKLLKIVVGVIALLIVLGWFGGFWGSGFKWR